MVFSRRLQDTSLTSHKIMKLQNFKEQQNVTAANTIPSQVLLKAVARNYYFTEVQKDITGI